MKPLTVRRAGAFEKSLLLATAAIGVVGSVSGVEISGSLGAALGPSGAPLYFASTMIGPGTLGFWAVRHSLRLRTPQQIRRECRIESLALVAVALGWSGFAAAAILVGYRAIAITLLVGIVCVGGALWRMVEIWHDLRKLAAAEHQPRLADPPPLAEGG